MIRGLGNKFDWMESRISQSKPMEKVGRVVEVRGLIIESEGPEACVGDVCELDSPKSGHQVLAEVVGFRENRLLLIPYWQTQHIHPGCRVTTSHTQTRIPVGEEMVGRVIDGLGRPMDGHGPIHSRESTPLFQDPPNAMTRRRIDKVMSTGVRAIDVFTPMGEGQRMGVFAGSGVGKSTLMGMIARGCEADVIVIGLVGERGRELREFIEKDLGEEGRKRSVVVVSTSDQAAPLRLRAAILTTALAEYFRDKGKRVMLLMDSVTRFAMAQREIGLAVGEPPTSRGYTPSVFSVLPRLLERTGMGIHGSITAIYTVLVEGDDFNEPVSDTLRGILDGHIVLRRALATANHYPAIDVLDSVSRLIREVATPREQNLVATARNYLALYRKNEDMVTIGAYNHGTNPQLDLAIDKHEKIMQLLKQTADFKSMRDDDFNQLEAILQ